jgi:hypothetical protein
MRPWPAWSCLSKETRLVMAIRRGRGVTGCPNCWKEFRTLGGPQGRSGQFGEGKSLATAGIRTPGRAFRNLVAIPIGLSQLSYLPKECYLCINFCPPLAQQPSVGQGPLIIEASRSHSGTPHSVELLWTSDRPVAETCT